MRDYPGGVTWRRRGGDFRSAQWVVLFTTEQGEQAAAGPFDASNAVFVADRCSGRAVRLRTAEAIIGEAS